MFYESVTMLQFSVLFGLLATATFVACAPAAAPAPTRMSSSHVSVPAWTF